jgi:hypothetical protein
MRKFWDIRAPISSCEGVRWQLLDADAVAVMEAVQVLDDDLLAGLEALEDLGPGEPDVALLDRPELHGAVLHDIDVLVEERPPRDDGLGRTAPHLDRHLPGDSRDQLLGLDVRSP